MYQASRFVECARAVRPHLSDLMGADANKLDARLVSLIVRAQRDEHMDAAIEQLLASNDNTRAWMEKYLQTQEEEEEAKKGFDPLYGSATPVAARKYTCPKCNFTWIRRTVGQSVPVCPKHRLPLKPRF